MGNVKWMTRDEWEVHVRTPYYDMFGDLQVSTVLGDYATEAEVALVFAELHRLYQDEGRKMRTAKLAAASLFARCPGNTVRERYDRFDRATPAEQEQLRVIRRHKENRQEIAVVVADLRKGVVPRAAQHYDPQD